MFLTAIYLFWFHPFHRPLAAAVQKKDIETLQKILENMNMKIGIDQANIPLMKDHTVGYVSQCTEADDALQEAVESNQVEAVNLLLKAGTEPSTSLLLRAIEIQCSAEIIEDIVKFGSTLDIGAALRCAVTTGCVGAVKVLLENKAVVTEVDPWVKQTLLHMAVFYQQPEVLVCLLEKPECQDLVNLKDRNGKTPLHLAGKGGHTDMIRVLLEAGADPLAKDKNGHCPQLDILPSVDDNVELLTRSYANAYTMLPGGRSLLHLLSSQQFCTKYLKLCIDKGANINKIAFDGSTPLMVAVKNNCLLTVKMLLEQPGIHVDAVDNTGCTALHMAIENGVVDILKMLVNSGANINKRYVIYFSAQTLTLQYTFIAPILSLVIM